MNDALELLWVKEVFDKHTKNCTIGQYRLLILNGHSSHITSEFNHYCLENSIVVLYMPPHSSYLLQPLDIVLKLQPSEVSKCWRVAIEASLSCHQVATRP